MTQKINFSTLVADHAFHDSSLSATQYSSSMSTLRHLAIRVPASTANLGPGFDTVGLALGLWLEVDAWIFNDFQAMNKHTITLSETSPTTTPSTPYPRLQITYDGQDPHLVPLDRSNLMIRSAFFLISKLSNPTEPVEFPHYVSILMRNAIPLSRGLGSSATAIVAGMLLANELCDYALSKDQLFNYVLELENHPDNVGASLFGGLVVGYMRSAEEVAMLESASSNLPPSICRHISRPWNLHIKAVCVVPDFELPTDKARAVLPASYSRSETVQNLQRLATLMLLLSSQTLPDPLMMHEALKDAIHQPYRMHLVPGLQEILNTINPLNTPGFLGCTLSGAGPTIQALATDHFEEIGRKIQSILSTQILDDGKVGISSRVFILNGAGGAEVKWMSK